MEPVVFHRSLFGFSRGQVRDYLCELDADHQHSLSSLKEECDARFEELTISSGQQIDQLSRSVQELTAERDRLADERNNALNDCKTLASGVVALREKSNLLSRQLEDQRAQTDALSAANERLSAELSQKDALQNHLNAQLAEYKAQLAERAVPSAQPVSDTSRTALIECIELLHTKNNELSRRVAQLEASASPSALREQVTPAAERLFESVRSEISDALADISERIRSAPQNGDSLRIVR